LCAEEGCEKCNCESFEKLLKLVLFASLQAGEVLLGNLACELLRKGIG